LVVENKNAINIQDEDVEFVRTDKKNTRLDKITNLFIWMELKMYFVHGKLDTY
jgi:hypothetical protein